MRLTDMYNYCLMHHGIKGQKWGRRRFQNEDGSYTNAGLNRYGFDSTLINGKGILKRHRMTKAQKVSYKLNNISDARKSRMTSRQKESYENAKKYWEARAIGKNTPKRNIVKRHFDVSRSESFANRAANAAATNLAIEAGLYALSKKSKTFAKIEKVIGKVSADSYKDAILSGATSTGKEFVTDELLNKVFGHY